MKTLEELKKEMDDAYDAARAARASVEATYVVTDIAYYKAVAAYHKAGGK